MEGPAYREYTARYSQACAEVLHRLEECRVEMRSGDIDCAIEEARELAMAAGRMLDNLCAARTLLRQSTPRG